MTISIGLKITEMTDYATLQWRREGGGRRGASAPVGTVQGAAFGGAKIWNY